MSKKKKALAHDKSDLSHKCTRKNFLPFHSCCNFHQLGTLCCVSHKSDMKSFKCNSFLVNSTSHLPQVGISKTYLNKKLFESGHIVDVWFIIRSSLRVYENAFGYQIGSLPCPCIFFVTSSKQRKRHL